MNIYHDLMVGTATLLFGRPLNPDRFAIETPSIPPHDLCGQVNPHPRISCYDENQRLMIALLLKLSGANYSAHRWSAVSYRWLLFSALMAWRGGGELSALLTSLEHKSLPPSTISAPDDPDLIKINRALRILQSRNVITVVRLGSTDYVCPTNLVIDYVRNE
ncbi:MAG: hypothetical protein V1738_02430 [Patescibacteria group bacterium]